MGSWTDSQPQWAGRESLESPKIPAAAPEEVQQWSNISGGLCTWKEQQEFPHPGKSQPHLFVPFASTPGAQLHQPKHPDCFLQQILSYYKERLTQESCSRPLPSAHFQPPPFLLPAHSWPLPCLFPLSTPSPFPPPAPGPFPARSQPHPAPAAPFLLIHRWVKRLFQH